MMDNKCIKSIIECIMQSNMSDLDFRVSEIRPIECHTDEEGELNINVQMSMFDSMGRKIPLSEAWVAGNLLLFTVFDGYLENKYHLIEGASFRNHYEALPENTIIERISKNCYRILKIIRNSIQHNLSNVVYNSGSYNINYNHRNTLFKLNISKRGIQNLYSLILNIIREDIMSIPRKYMTSGHYEGILYTLYTEMLDEITQISDDIGTDLLDISNKLKLRAVVRYPVENPYILKEDDSSILFLHIENNCTDDESSYEYGYSTDYTYKNYLLPQEIGTITKGEGNTFRERAKSATICFEKKCLEDKWKKKNE